MDRGLGWVEGWKKGQMETLFGLVQDGFLTISIAANQAKMDVAVFEQKYKDWSQRM